MWMHPDGRVHVAMMLRDLDSHAIGGDVTDCADGYHGGDSRLRGALQNRIDAVAESRVRQMAVRIDQVRHATPVTALASRCAGTAEPAPLHDDQSSAPARMARAQCQHRWRAGR